MFVLCSVGDGVGDAALQLLPPSSSARSLSLMTRPREEVSGTEAGEVLAATLESASRAVVVVVGDFTGVDSRSRLLV